MSWSFAAEAHTARLRDALDASFREYNARLLANDQGLSAEAKAQVDAAASAAVAIATSKALGEAEVAVTLSGHANPSHSPLAGQANDFISVQIARVDVAPAEQPPPMPDATQQDSTGAWPPQPVAGDPAAPAEPAVAAQDLAPAPPATTTDGGVAEVAGPGSVAAEGQPAAGEATAAPAAPEAPTVVSGTEQEPPAEPAPDAVGPAAASAPEPGPVQVQVPGPDTAPADPTPAEPPAA